MTPRGIDRPAQERNTGIAQHHEGQQTILSEALETTPSEESMNHNLKNN